jgi:hypothetical protein
MAGVAIEQAPFRRRFPSVFRPFLQRRRIEENAGGPRFWRTARPAAR